MSQESASERTGTCQTARYSQIPWNGGVPCDYGTWQSCADSCGWNSGMRSRSGDAADYTLLPPAPLQEEPQRLCLGGEKHAGPEKPGAEAKWQPAPLTHGGNLKPAAAVRGVALVGLTSCWHLLKGLAAHSGPKRGHLLHLLHWLHRQCRAQRAGRLSRTPSSAHERRGQGRHFHCGLNHGSRPRPSLNTPATARAPRTRPRLTG